MRSLAIDGWIVRALGPAATVPRHVRGRDYPLGASGYVHEALASAGAIPDIDAVGGEEAQEWIGRTDWSFVAWVRVGRTELRHRRVDIAFDWIDTVGDVIVNGVRAVAVATEFVPVRAPVRALLVEGVNEVEVRLRGPVDAVEALARRYGRRPVNGDWTPYCYLRKCASNFGWDWGPRAATVGVGGARLEMRDGARIASVRPLVVACDERVARLEVYVECELARGPIEVRGRLSAPVGSGETFVSGGATDAVGRVMLRFEIPRPRRWWPRGLGEQPLYRLEVVTSDEGCSFRSSIGLRTVELDTSADVHGSRFLLRVNGTEVWCRGANWVPRTPFPRATTVAAERLELLAADANLNMLRVWGGGIYESDAFYERCDALGILVWQDFMFACATYPEEAPYPDLVDREARHQVARLSTHPSVALWCGGNEDILAWWSWGWRERLAEGQTWGASYWLERLPAVVRELDPTRPYWPESPFSGSMERHPNDPDHGDRHTWDLRLEGYRTAIPRFCSEFGHQSPPTRAALGAVVPFDDPVGARGELVRRQRAWGGDGVQYAPFIAERFRPPRSLDEWVFAAQLLQARAYELAILWMRANAPRCMGALFWQLNDVWTGHSWSVVDARGHRKPAYFAVRRACATEALAVLPGRVPAAADMSVESAPPCRVVLCRADSDESREWPRDVRLRWVCSDGETVADERVRLVVDSSWTATAPIPSYLQSIAHPERTVLVADCGPCRAVHAPVHDAAFAFGRSDVALIARADPPALEIEARSLVRDLCVDERLGPHDGLVTLLPGERWRVALDAPTAVADLAHARVMSAADIGGAGDCHSP